MKSKSSTNKNKTNSKKNDNNDKINIVIDKKTFIVVTSIIAILAVIGIILLCINKKDSIHTVRFILENNNYTEAQVKDGELLEPIEVSNKEGYVFEGWIFNDELFDFNTPIKEDISISASYLAEQEYIEKINELEKKEDKEENKNVEVSNIVMNVKTLSLNEGETSILVASISPIDASNKTITWESSDTSIITVSNGKVKAIKKGTATVTATSNNGISTSCVITVKDILVSKIQVESNYSVLLGKTITIAPMITPSNASNKTLSYKVEDTSIATINNGVITGLKKGKTSVKITSSNGVEVSTIIEVVDSNIPVSKVVLDKSSYTLNVNATAKLNASIEPNNATDKSVKWSSSNTNIVTVDQNGNIKGIKEGTAIITVDVNGKSATCSVTVKEIMVTNIQVTNKYSVLVGKTITIKPTISPMDATNKNVTYSVEDNKIATVNSNGLVTGIKEGQTKVTITSSNGIKATTLIEVIDNNVPVKSIDVEKSSYTVDNGNTVKIKATVKPTNASDQSLIWSSSNTAIATVDQNGNVNGIKPGSAMIIIQANGAQTNVIVTVKAVEASQLYLTDNSLTLRKDTRKAIKYSIYPNNATNKSVTFTSSDTSIATVDSNGNVTGIKAGKTTVTVKTYNGITKSIPINVYRLSCTWTGAKIDYEREVCYNSAGVHIECPDGYTRLGISTKCANISDYKEPECPDFGTAKGVYNRNDGYCYYSKASLNNNTEAECLSVSGRTWVKGACYYNSAINDHARVETTSFDGKCPSGYYVYNIVLGYQGYGDIHGCYKPVEGTKGCLLDGWVLRGDECRDEHEAQKQYY